MWSDLPREWQICLEEGWNAYVAGSLPIGAAIFDPNGKLISQACSQIGHKGDLKSSVHDNPLAHAELNVLLEMFTCKSEPHKVVLYTLLEPCPLCMGAIYMAGVRQVWYAARDAFAGSANLIGKTEYLSRKPVKVTHLADHELELVVTALHVTAVLLRIPEKAGTVLKAQERITADAVAFGRYLVEEGWLEKMMKTDPGPKDVYENLLYLYNEKFLKISV